MTRHQPGFTLIETMIAIVIMSILIVMGVPSFSAFLANTKLRSSAESLLTGLQLARADAVRRNANVEFLLTTAIPTSATVATAVAAANGENWMVRATDPITLSAVLVEGKQGVETSSRTQGTASPVTMSATAASIIFNGLGGANAATFQFSNPTGGACAPAGPIRCLNIVVSPGGRVRMCDPAVTAAQITAGDTRGC